MQLLCTITSFHHQTIQNTNTPMKQCWSCRWPQVWMEFLSIYSLQFYILTTPDLFHFTVIIWHFAAISYSLYKKIDEKNCRPTILPQTTARTAGTTTTSAVSRSPPPQPTTTAPPSPPPSYDRVFKTTSSAS